METEEQQLPLVAQHLNDIHIGSAVSMETGFVSCACEH